MPTDDELRDMLRARADRASTGGLLEDARLIALGAGRRRMDRWRFSGWPLAAAGSVVAVVVVLAVALSAIVLTPPPGPTAGPGSSSEASLSPSVEPSPVPTVAPQVQCPKTQSDVTTVGCQEAFRLVFDALPADFGPVVKATFVPKAPCGPGVFCAFRMSAQGMVILTRPTGELMVVDVTPGPSGSLTTSSIKPFTLPSGGWTKATARELAKRSVSDGFGTFVVDGWLVATPPLRCRGIAAAPSGVPNFGCSEMDWLTDEPFLPWTRANDPLAVMPVNGVRVPNGSYAAFAPDPTFTPDSGNEPRRGTWLVRASVGSTCLFLPQNSREKCAGGPVLIFEILARLSP